MNKLEEARDIINQIDEKMVFLFIERMKASKMIAEYKKENHLEIGDKRREQELILKNLSLLNQKELEKYYQIFFQGILEASKSYQRDLLK